MKKLHAVIFTDMSSKIWHVRPLGAYRIASELRSKGFEVLVVDFFSRWLDCKKDFFKLLEKIISEDTLFVGYSSTFFSKNDSKSEIKNYSDYYGENIGYWPEDVQVIEIINRYIKKLSPRAKIFYGGSKTGNIVDDIENSGVDYVVQGFADHTIVEILQNLYDGKSIRYDINKSRKVKVINSDLLGSNFDFPKSITRYHESDCIQKNEIIPLETSRGCLFKCKFCAYPLLGRKKNDPKYHKEISLLTEELIKNYENFGITKYTMIDDTFNESTAKLEQIYQSIKDSKVNIEFSCYLRLDLVDRYNEQIQLLKEMGMKSCFLGIETLNMQSAKSIGKSSDITKVKHTLEKCRKIWGDDVAIFASFIVGLPYDTESTVDSWMSWVYDQTDIIDSYNLTALQLTDKYVWPSEIGKNPEKFGYQLVDGEKWINNVGMSNDQAKHLVRSWMEHSWNSGRLGVAGWEMMGMQNFGYDFAQLRKFRLNNLPIQEFYQKYQHRFDNYKKDLLEYVN